MLRCWTAGSERILACLPQSRHASSEALTSSTGVCVFRDRFAESTPCSSSDHSQFRHRFEKALPTGAWMIAELRAVARPQGWGEFDVFDGRVFRMLNVLDEFSRESLAVRVRRKLSSIDVIDVLTDLFILRGIPWMPTAAGLCARAAEQTCTTGTTAACPRSPREGPVGRRRQAGLFGGRPAP